MENILTNLDPIKIIIPEDLFDGLQKDALIFETNKNDDEKIVMNTFINHLIYGYFYHYRDEVSGQSQRIREILRPYIDTPQKLEDAVRSLNEERMEKESQNLRTERTKALHFRAVAKTDSIISDLNDHMLEIRETQARYYRSMLYSYSRLPIYEREKVIYQDTAELLNRACESKREINFTIRNKKRKVHKAVPYKLVHGQDERHNYLLCQEINEITNKPFAVSYRLCRIMNPRIIGIEGKIDGQIKNYLDRMERLGPQHSINDDTISCVELSEEGRRSYMSIYNDRPILERMDPPDAYGKRKYYFQCAQTQLFLYFRRFNPGEATILSPRSLADSIQEFHRSSLECSLQTRSENAP